MKVTINSREQQQKGGALFTTDKKKEIVVGEISVGILEKAGKKNTTQIHLFIEGDNEVYTASIDMAVFMGLARTIIGADNKFKANKNGSEKGKQN